MVAGWDSLDIVSDIVPACHPKCTKVLRMSL